MTCIDMLSPLQYIRQKTLGIFLWLWPKFDFSHIRWAGVLPRISLVFLACALLFLYTNWKQQLKISIGILVGYWIIMAYLPIPGIGSPDLSVPEKNWANFLDYKLLPGVIYRKTWDPEGLLSTFPAIVSGITGMLIGRIIMDTKDDFKKLSWIFFWGWVMLTLGNILDWFFPINKHIWTSSYVLYTSGLATLTLAAFILIVDMLSIKKWTQIGRVFGANSIGSYVLAGMLTLVFYRDIFGDNGLNDMFMETVTGIGIAPKLASLGYAIIYMFIIYIPAYILYKKKIFIKV